MEQLDLIERLRELPYRIRPVAHASGGRWPLSMEEVSRVRIHWPSSYQWPGTGYILESLKDAFEYLGVLKVENLEQKFEHVVYLICTVRGEHLRVTLDYCDYQDFINQEALAISDIYFKMMFRSKGYEDNRIIRGGYTVTRNHYYKYYKVFRESGNKRPQIDIMARFGFRFQAEYRQRAIDLLTSMKDVSVAGKAGKVRYSTFLREISQSKLALHMPGNGPFTHRVVEYIGLGACMISIPFETEIHVPLLQGVHYISIEPDLSDLREKVRYYLSNHEERRKIADAGAQLFDECCHCEHLARYYVSQLLAFTGSETR